MKISRCYPHTDRPIAFSWRPRLIIWAHWKRWWFFGKRFRCADCIIRWLGYDLRYVSLSFKRAPKY